MTSESPNLHVSKKSYMARLGMLFCCLKLGSFTDQVAMFLPFRTFILCTLIVHILIKITWTSFSFEILWGKRLSGNKIWACYRCFNALSSDNYLPALLYFLWYNWKKISLKTNLSQNGFCWTLDINECSLGLDDCHSNAECINIKGSFNCICKRGYQGNGSFCEGW